MLEPNLAQKANLPTVWQPKSVEAWNSPSPAEIIDKVRQMVLAESSGGVATTLPSASQIKSVASGDTFESKPTLLGPPPVNRALEKALQTPLPGGSRLFLGSNINPFRSLQALTISPGNTHKRETKRLEQPIKLSVEGTIELEQFLHHLKGPQLGSPKSLQINDIDKSLLEALLRADYGALLVTALSMGDQVYAAVTATNGKISKQGRFPQAISRDVNFLNPDQTFTASKSNNVFSVYPSSALALSLLASGTLDLLGLLIAQQPERIIGDLLNIPLKGCLFSADALLAVLKHLAPVASDNEFSASSKARAVDALLKNYYKFANPYDDVTLLPKKLRVFHDGSKYSDILALQGSPFIGEVLHLISKFSADSMHVEAFASKESIEELEKNLYNAAWCISAIVGNSFQYLGEFIGRLRQDQKHINVSARRITSFFKD